MFRFKCKYELKFAEIGVQNSMEVQKQEHTDGGLNNEIVKQGQNGLVFINSNSYASVREDKQFDSELRGKTSSSFLFAKLSYPLMSSTITMPIGGWLQTFNDFFCFTFSLKPNLCLQVKLFLLIIVKAKIRKPHYCLRNNIYERWKIKPILVVTHNTISVVKFLKYIFQWKESSFEQTNYT